MTQSTDVGQHSNVVAAVAISVIAMSAFLILPLLVGAAAESLAMTEVQLGYMAAACMSGSALSSIAAIFWIRRVHWRWAAGAALSVMLIGNAACLWLTNIPLFIVALWFVGLGGGAAYSIALTVLSDQPQADRCFGLSVAAQVTFQIVGLLFLPDVIQRYGLEGILLTLMICLILGMILLPWLPAAGRSVTQRQKFAVTLSPPVLLALLGCFMFFFNVGVVWTYIERMAVNSGMSMEIIGQSLAIGVAFGVPGALLASLCGERFGRLGPLTVAASISVLSLLLLSGSFSRTEYVLGLALYNFSWNYSLSYQYAVVNNADNSGRSVAVAPAFHAMGSALGPGVAVLFISAESYLAVNVLACIGVLASLLLFGLATTRCCQQDSVLI
jgi:predicted MFS family arabinose efflux permease